MKFLGIYFSAIHSVNSHTLLSTLTDGEVMLLSKASKDLVFDEKLTKWPKLAVVIKILIY